MALHTTLDDQKRNNRPVWLTTLEDLRRLTGNSVAQPDCLFLGHVIRRGGHVADRTKTLATSVATDVRWRDMTVRGPQDRANPLQRNCTRWRIHAVKMRESCPPPREGRLSPF